MVLQVSPFIQMFSFHITLRLRNAIAKKQELITDIRDSLLLKCTVPSIMAQNWPWGSQISD